MKNKAQVKKISKTSDQYKKRKEGLDAWARARSNSKSNVGEYRT